MTTLEKLEEKLKEIQYEVKLLRDESQKTKWEQSGGILHLDHDGSVNNEESDASTRLYGVEFSKKRQAKKKVKKAFKKYHLIYQLGLELNDGWTPDWANKSQSKFIVSYDHYNNCFFKEASEGYEKVGSIYFKDESTAQKAIDIIKTSDF